MIIGYGKAAVGRVWCQLEEQATTNEYTIKFQCLPTGPGGVAEVIVAATHEDTIDDIKGKIVAEVNRDDFSKDGFRIMRNGKYCDDLWRRALEYGTGPAIWSIVIKLQGGAVIKKDLKQNKNHAKLQAMADQLKETSKAVSTHAMTINVVGILEPVFRDFSLKVNANAKEALSDQLHKLSIAEIEQLSSAFNSAGAGSAEGKFKVNGHLLFGDQILLAKELHSSLGAVIDSATMLSTMAYTKATTEDATFSLRSFNSMMAAVLNFKRGQASSSSAVMMT